MISQIKLTHFKSFHQASFDLGPLTLLVGANAAGKSNIRDALRVLHGMGLGYSLAEVLGGRYGAGGILQWRGIRGGAREVPSYGSDVFSLAVKLSAPGPVPFRSEETHAISIDVSNEQLGPRVTAEVLRGAYDSNPSVDPVKQESEHELRVRQPRGGAHRAHGRVSRFPSSKPVLSQLPDRGKEPAALRARCERVLEQLQSMRFLDLDPDAMREASPPGQTVLGDRGENLSSVLQAICREPTRKASLLAWVRGLTPLDAHDFAFKLDLQGRVLVFLVEASGQQTSAISASDGTLRFLALAAALLSPDSGKIYFFEEFDNGIHPTRLHLLLELVQQACREQDTQVIGTTHNPALLAFLDHEALQHAVLVYRPEDVPDSRLRRIVDLPDFRRIQARQDLGRLHASGWLEDAAAFTDAASADRDEASPEANP